MSDTLNRRSPASWANRLSPAEKGQNVQPNAAANNAEGKQNAAAANVQNSRRKLVYVLAGGVGVVLCLVALFVGLYFSGVFATEKNANDDEIVHPVYGAIMEDKDLEVVTLDEPYDVKFIRGSEVVRSGPEQTATAADAAEAGDALVEEEASAAGEEGTDANRRRLALIDDCAAHLAALKKSVPIVKNYTDASKQSTTYYKQSATAHGEALSSYGYKPTPCVIFFASTEQHVVNAVKWAKTNKFNVVARSGRHDFLGHSTAHKGVVIDISLITDKKIDSKKNFVMGAGVRNQEAYDYIGTRGRMMPGGLSIGVGASGLALGGGWGKMHRYTGLTSDNLIGARVVTADGKVTVANETYNKDLLWGLRGAGHTNFGIVTQLTFRTLASTKFGQVKMSFGSTSMASALRTVNDAFSTLDKRISLDITIQNGTAFFNWFLPGGTASELQKLLPSPLNTKGTLTNYGSFQSAWVAWAGCSNNATCVAQCRSMSRGSFTQTMESTSGFFNAISDDLVKLVQTNKGTSFLRLLGGAMNALPSDHSAWNHRNFKWVAEFFFFREQCKGDQACIDNRRASIDQAYELTYNGPEALKKIYVNYPVAKIGAGYPEAYWGDNYSKLRQIKAKWDPAWMFRDPQGIVPAGM
eukprot:GDKI01009328.1.p1 GENE.GDKI01009328.1~~GDKI01009328.1.p1  ORF type:complete len:652 (+),score=182.33 GDKI01009328.1:43-1956(+)